MTETLSSTRPYAAAVIHGPNFGPYLARSAVHAAGDAARVQLSPEEEASEVTGTEETSDTESDSEPAETGAEASNEEESETDYFVSAFPNFDAVTESGSGDSVINLPAEQGLITASHPGSSNFALTVLDGSNEMAELPVNTIGSYEGTTAFRLSASVASPYRWRSPPTEPGRSPSLRSRTLPSSPIRRSPPATPPLGTSHTTASRTSRSSKPVTA